MKILATSDTHGDLTGLDLSNINLALFAGDIAPLRNISSWDVYDQLKWMNDDFFNWCNLWPNTKIVFIPGNHDFFPLIKEMYGYKLRIMDLNLKLASNATMLIDQMIEVNGLKIYGTPWVPIINYRWAFEAEHDKLKCKFSMIPEDVDILLTHTPPRHEKLGISLEYGEYSENFGCSELTDEVFKKEPKMCFCGHIHSGDHNMNVFGNTKIWNVSRVNESYKIAYEPTLLYI